MATDPVLPDDVLFLRNLLQDEIDHLSNVLKQPGGSTRLHESCKTKLAMATRWLERLNNSYPKKAT